MMSIFAPLRQLVLMAFAAVKTSKTVKVYLLLAALVVGLAGGLWWYVAGLQDAVKSQQNTITKQGKTIEQQSADTKALTGDRDEILRQRNSERLKTQQLSKEIELNGQKLLQAQQRADEFKKKIDELQKSNPCAGSPLPDGVVRMLNADAKEFNDQYR